MTPNIKQIILQYMRAIILLSVFLAGSGQANELGITDTIKSYITGIKSIAVEFVQTDNHNKPVRGMLIIDKPYKFRCNYYRPFPLLIVGNKNYVSIYDYEMKSLSRIKSEENIFNFLLMDDINLNSQFEILSAKESSNGAYIIKLKNHNLNTINEISFNKKNKNIQQLKIVEENNIIVITFEHTEVINQISNNLFILKDPDIFGTPERFNKTELEKRFKIIR
ncbi:MAG: outer membrane lipoprotein carrier protein LolA [Rickettsiaceae bacterium]